ncbi:unnamed protein product [Linum tenue]|uniref:Uncharacterized protein n=1 Tax=Linum tenue TaxID=586396 RepID=A0AAV0GNP3_9ROSI|nr:unnamed protein product [Linum tenue]
MVKKQKIDVEVDPVVVTDDESDSDMDLEPRPGLKTPSPEQVMDVEVYTQQWREQTAWNAEEALKYYKETHQVTSASALPESSPPTPKMVVVNNDDGSSSSSSSSPVESSPPTPVAEELFFAETAMYSGDGLKLTVHSCIIIDPSGPVLPSIGCFYCSKSLKHPFYHPPEEQLVFGKRDCDKGIKYDDDWTDSDDEPAVPR